MPILRAGGEMVEPLLELMPEASVRHLGLYREKGTLSPTEVRSRFGPADLPVLQSPTREA